MRKLAASFRGPRDSRRLRSRPRGRRRHRAGSRSTRATDQPVTRNRTVMIQGNKQKMVTDRAQVVTDLDSGTMYLMNPEKKQYVAVPFPPTRPDGSR
jgi:hypothetical protein